MNTELNFGGYIAESLRMLTGPTTTMGDLYAQLSRATGIDQERLVQMGNGVFTELSEEQIYRIARVLNTNPDTLLKIYRNDVRALRGEYQPAAPANPQTPVMTFAQQIGLAYQELANVAGLKRQMS